MGSFFLYQNEKDKKIKEQEYLINNPNLQLKEKDEKIYKLLSQIKEKEEKIKKLLSQIKEKDDKINNLSSQLKSEKIKNNDLSNLLNELNNTNNNLKNKIKELELKQQNINLNNQFIQNDSNDSNKIIQLYNKIEDLNEKLKRAPYILEENEKLISVIFTSIDESLYYSMICKNTDTIQDLEKDLYKEYPDFSLNENYFVCKGKVVNKFETFKNHKIKNGDIIILNQKID